jgi:hypothetical protein
MYIVILNFRDITEDVLDINLVTKEMEIGQSVINASQCTVELNNLDRKYDDDLMNSLFYASGWYNKTLSVFDTENNIVVFIGKVKGYEATEKSVKIQGTNYFKELLDITCNYSQVNLTAPEHIYNIITTVAGLPLTIISYGAYINAVTKQQAANIKINVNVSLEANYSCLDVIETLCKMTGLELYEKNNLLIMDSWTPYNGAQGTQIYNDDYIPGTFKQYYDDKLFFNQLVCAYSTGSSVAYHTVTNEFSVFQYNITKTQKYPDNNNTSTLLEDYKVYYTNATSAQNAATLLLQKYSMPLKFCEFTLKPNYTSIQIGDILNLHFSDFHNEPVKVLKIDYKDIKIDIKAMYLNKPNIYYTPEFEIINPVTITNVMRRNATELSCELSFQFTDLNENIFKYLVYFRPADGDWVGTNSLQGLSPIELRADRINVLPGSKYFVLSDLKPFSNYQIRIVAISNQGTKSDFSNIAELTSKTIITTIGENKFYTKGDLLNGIMIDLLNSEGGILPSQINSDWTLYNSYYYGERYYSPNAIYESGLIITENYLKDFLFYINCEGENNIKWQYRINNELTWSQTHDKEELINFNCPTNTKSIQFRFIFYGVNWTANNFIQLVRYSEV